MLARKFIPLFGGVRSPLTLAGAPAAVFSAVRLWSWSGAYARVVRASDSAEMDVTFRNNVPDYQSVLTWAAGSAVTYKKLYDQSGNGNDLTQTTAANQPSFSATSLVNGMMPVIFDGVFGGTGKALVIPASLALSRVNFSAFMAIRQVISLEYQSFFEFTSGGVSQLSHFTYGDPGAGFETGVDTFDGAVVALSAVRPRGQMTTIAHRSNASNQIFTVNGTSSTKAASSAATMNAGGTIGTAIGQPAYNLKGDMFALAFYASSVSDTVHDQVLAQFNSAFAVPQNFTKRLIYDGSSLVSCHKLTYNQGLTRKIRMPSDVEIYNLGRTNGQTLATAYANRSIPLGLYDATKTVNVTVIDAPANDLYAHAAFANAGAAQTWADDTYNNTTLLYVAAIKAKGANSLAGVPTMMSLGGFDTTSNYFETARIRYNDNVRAGAVANGYTLIDRASDPNLGLQFACLNPAFFDVDTIHPNDNGMDAQVVIERPALMTMLG